MKKAYSKPEIMFEDFSLSTSIAAGCEVNPNTFQSGCGIKFGSDILFTGSGDDCTRKVADGSEHGSFGGMYDGLCYHNPSAEFNVFMS